MISKANKRVYQIDLLRFLAALSVVFYHYLFRGPIIGSHLSFFDFGNYFKYGYLGVDLFFIISGFVISLSIKQKSLRNFVISRITRLYPTYWICVSLTFCMILLLGEPNFTANFKQFVFNLTMFQNYFMVKNIDGAYWTLFVEMKFYIFIIGTYLFANRYKRIQFDSLIFIWTLLSILYVYFNDFFIMKVLNYFLILNWGSYFIAGMIFYQIFKNRISVKYVFLLIMSLIISIFHALSKIPNLNREYNASFSPFVIAGVIISFYALMLLISIGKLQKFNSPKLLKIGMLTYPLYLIHQNIGYIIFNKFDGYVNKYLLVIFTLMLMLFVSTILSEFYEPKFSNKLKSLLQQLTSKNLMRFWPIILKK